MNLLNNGGYYNRTSDICYIGANNATTVCDFSGSGLTDNAKNMIDTITWNLGSNGYSSWDAINTSTFYNIERSNNTGKICSSSIGCNDSIPRTISWYGQVGLMNPSDYGYATSGGVTTDRATCLNIILYSWSSVSDCASNDWLYNASQAQWTIIPHAFSSEADRMFIISNYKSVSTTEAVYAARILPTIYLKTIVKVKSGSGTIDLPYELSV